MRTKNYYRIRLLVRIAFWSTLLIGITYIVGHINWVGDHYCWGSFDKCYGLNN
jgi:hypothetical protein